MKEEKNIIDETFIEDIKPEEIYKYCENVEVGKIVEGKIIDVTNEGIFIDIGSKTDAFIPKEEFSYKNLNEIFKPQQIIKVMVLKINYNNLHLVSYKKAKEIELKELFKKNFEEKIPMDAILINLTEYGYIVDIGIDALLPYKELGKQLKETLQKQNISLGVNCRVVIKDIKETNKGLEIIVSNKLYEEVVRKELKEKLLSHLKEGDEVIGEVKSITSFGAFVEIEGVEALLHISDMAWFKVKDPKDILKVNDKIKVKVLKIDKDTEKISVGLKQLFPHPWDDIEKKFSIGEVVKCKIVNLTDYGIFVELEPGIEGLIHLSEISWEEKTPNIKKKYIIGQEIEAKIINIDKINRRISLSIKKIYKNPWEDLKKQIIPKAKYKGRITKITPFGIYVELKPGFEGFIHKSNICWFKRTENLLKNYKIGEYIEFVVLEIIPEQEKAILSIKHLQENPFEKYKVDTIVKCKVKKILRNMLIVSLEPNVEGVIHKREAITEGKTLKELKSFYRIGQELDAVVVLSDEEKAKIELSIKRLEKVIQKQLIKKFSTVERPSLKDILQEE